MAQRAPPGGYMMPGPPPPMMAQQYVVTIQNTGHVGPSPMKVKAIKVTGQIQLSCGLVSIILGIIAINLTCEGYLTGTPIWSGLSYFIAGVLGLFGAHKKSRCIIIAYMVLSIISSVIAVQQVFMSITFAAVLQDLFRETCLPLNAISSAVGLLEIVGSIVAAAYCCRIVCCGQASTTMVQYVPASPVGVPQPGMLQGQSVYSPVTCPAAPGEATILSVPAHPPPYSAEGGELPPKQNLTGPYHSTTGVDGDNPAPNESLLS